MRPKDLVMFNNSSKKIRQDSAADSQFIGQRILGIDPGLQITGYGVIEAGSYRPVVREAGIIRSEERRGSADMAERLRSLYDGLLGVIDQFQPRAVAVEQLYAHYQHPRTA